MPNYLEKTQNLSTIVDFLRFGMSQAILHQLYYGHGTDNAADDLRLLILGSLHLPYDLASEFLQSRVTDEERVLLCNNLEQRIHKRVPVPYLIHEAYFCDLSFYVDERVLIPRSPIAELIRQQFEPWVDSTNVTRILDLCTGSGCIAIACCYAFPDALVDAVDLSRDALDVSEINRKRHNLEDQLTLIQSDCFTQVPVTKYDIIVSNPPYVGSDEMQSLPKEYLHEPRLALEAENNGLAIVEKILQYAYDYLSEQGILVVEVGNSEEFLLQSMPHIPFTWIEFEHGGHGVFVLTREQLMQQI
jgi:ribosomal protein L3 glutamine methyltransferase